MKNTPKKAKKSRIIILLVTISMILGAIGIVSADEKLPYTAHTLYLIKDSEKYDLLEGITYDKKKYKLTVEDEGGFDIHVTGKYKVSYRLTALTQSTEGRMTVKSRTYAAGIPSKIKIRTLSRYEDQIPSEEEVKTPSVEATQAPSAEETQAPSAEPAETPSVEATQTPSAEPTKTPSVEASPTPSVNPTKTPSTDTTPMPSAAPDSIGFTRYVIVQEPGAQIRYDKDPLQFYPETVLYEALSSKEAVLGDDTAEVRYELRCKDAALLTADAYVLDKSGGKVKDAAITVKNDAELRAACTVAETTKGTTKTMVCRMKPGTYSITLASTDPDTGKEITAERTVEILPSEERLIFDAPILYLEKTQMDYDLTKDVTVTDETGKDLTESTKIYVVEEQELLDAIETITDEAGGEPVRQFRIGSYLVTIGALDPETGTECTAQRRVEVTDGYYLYAPDMEIETGVTQYDMLEGVELRSIKDDSVINNVEINVNESDMSALRQSAMTEEERNEFVETMEKAGEEPAAAMEIALPMEVDGETVSNPPLKEGTYSYEIEAVDPATGQTYTTIRMLSVRTIRNNLAMYFEAGAYKDRLEAKYQEGDIDALILGSLNQYMYRQFEGADPNVPGQKPVEVNGPEMPVPNGYKNYVVRELYYSNYAGDKTYYNPPQKFPLFTTYHYQGLESPSLAEVLGMQVDFEILKSKARFHEDKAVLQDIHYPHPTKYQWEYIAPVTRLPEILVQEGGRSQLKQASINGTVKLGDTYDYQAENVNISLGPFGSIWSKTWYYIQTPNVGSADGIYEGHYFNPLFFGRWINNTKYAAADVNGDWNHYLNGDRTLPLYRDGGLPDVTVTANAGQTITDVHLDFENFDREDTVDGVLKKYYMDNLTPEASLRINLNGESLNGTNKVQLIPAMQVSLENGLLATDGENRRMNYELQKDSWLRLRGFRAENGADLMTAEALLNRQMKITASGQGTLVFEGGENPAYPDALYALVENKSGTILPVELRTRAGEASIGTPKLFEVSGGASNLDFFVDMAENTSIAAFNLSAKTAGEAAENPARRLRLKGNGVLYFNSDVNIPGAEGLYAHAYTDTVLLDNDVTVMKSEKSPQGGDATNLPALQIAQALLHNGYKVAAGVKQAAAPADRELFAQADGFVLDPTDFTVNMNGMDGAWTNDGTWFMVNADDDNTKIVFRKDMLLAKTPVKVTHNGVKQYFATYKEALAYIENQADTDYTVTNLRSMDFTAEDLAQLKAMKKTGRSIVFTGATEGAGAVTYGKCYHVRFREPLVELPAGYDITFDQPVKYDQGGREAVGQEIFVEFVKNGGVLSFDTKFMTADVRRESVDNPDTYGDVERLAAAYGGGVSGNCKKDAVINIKTGKFAAVYGGNRDGKHTGNAEIHIDSMVAGGDALFIRRLDGASAGETKKPGKRTAVIDSKGVHSIQNLYNYDTLTVINGKLTIPEVQQEKAANLDSCLAADYAGVTILQDESTLELLNRNGTRKMGSLIRPADAAGEKTPSLILARAVTVNGYDPLDKRNPYLVQLTAQDPFNIDGLKPKNKIHVSYSDNAEKEAGDIIFNLIGVVDTPQQREKYVSTKQLYNGFDPMKMLADVTERTIKLADASVLLLGADGTILSMEMDIAGAIVRMAAEEEKAPGGTYTIAVFKNGYQISNLDREAVEYARGKEGAFYYMEENYPNVQLAAGAAKITWSGGYAQDGTLRTNAADYSTVHPRSSFNFFARENVIEKTKLNYTGAGQDKSLFANGIPLTVEETVTMEGDTLPDLCGGGSTDTTGNTSLIIKGGTYDGIYGGSSAVNVTTTGEKKIVILKEKLEARTIRDFTLVEVGGGSAKQRELSVTEKIDSNPVRPAGVEDTELRSGIVHLRNAHLKLTGNEKSIFGELKADATQNVNLNTGNKVTVPKIDGVTRPMKLDGVTRLEDAKQPVTIATSTKEAAGDIVVEYRSSRQADETQYKTYAAGLYVRREGNVLKLHDSILPIDIIELWEKTDADADFVKVDAYSSYAKALRAIGAGDPAKTYKLVNLVWAEFTEEDQQALLEKRQAKELIFEGAPYNTVYKGTINTDYFNNIYMIQFKKLKGITLPAGRGYGIIFNQPVSAMAQKNGVDFFEFYNNGGTLTFGEKFSSRNYAVSTWDMIVYGGAEAGECTGNAVIRIKAGQFRAIYGGNKTGTYTGAVDITVDCPADRIQANGNNLRITRLDGATAEKSDPLETEMIQKAGANQAHNWQPGQVQRENQNKKVSITIQNTPVTGKTGVIQIYKLYNYDELDVKSGTLKVPNVGNYTYNLVSSLVGGYAGKTVIWDDAELRLENTYGYRMMGSLSRQAGADVTKQAKLFYNRCITYQVAPTDIKNPFVITLYGEDPFEVYSAGFSGRKITVSNNSEVENDIVFKLTGVKDDKYVTLKGIKSGFNTFTMYPKKDDRTIRLQAAYTMLTDPAGNRTKYRDIAGAITALADMEKARKNQGNLENWNSYTISMFQNDYVMNWTNTTTKVRRAYQDECLAMAYAAGKGDGVFSYLEEEYPDLAEMVKDAKVTWDGKKNSAGAIGKTWIEFYAAGDLNFFGTDTVIDGLILNFKKHGNQDALLSRDIYANGGNLTFNRDTYVRETTDTSTYPSLYGGTSKEAGTNKKKGGTITLLAPDLNGGDRLRFYDLKDFTNLTMGDDGKSGRAQVAIYGQLSDKLAIDEVKAADAAEQTLGESIVGFFRSIKDGFLQAVGLQDPPVEDNGGTMYLNYAYLKLLGYHKSYVTNVRVSSHINNYMTIPKDNTDNMNLTYPLQVAGTLTLDDPEAEKETAGAALINQRLAMLVSTTPVHGDVLVQFKQEVDAKERQYRSGHANYVIRKDKRSIILSDTRNKDLDPIWLYITQENESLDGREPDGKFRTYAEAFEFIQNGDQDKVYTFKNVLPVDFTQDDQDELLKKRNVKEFVFISGPNVPAYGAANYYGRYAVTFRIQSLELPSDYGVTFDGVIHPARTGRLEIINNGGKLHFGTEFTTSSNGNRALDLIVYGGARQGACAKDADILVEAGQFYAIYGGNKEGTYTGNVNITIDCPVERIAAPNANKLYITRLDGATAEKSDPLETDMIDKASKNQALTWQPGQVQRENGNKKVSIAIQNTPVTGKTGVIQIYKLYNYDELDVKSGTLKVPNVGNYTYNLVSSLVGGYAGKTVIWDDAELRLENTYGYRMMGSLSRQAGADVTKQAKLFYNRCITYQVAPTDIKNPFVITLYGEDPFEVYSAGFSGRKITVSNNSEVENDIVFKLTGVKDDKYVTLKGIKSGFNTFTMYPKKDDRTIRLQAAYTMLTDPAGNRTKYRDIAGAITALADMEKARKEQANQENWNTYKISFFRNEAYIMNWKNTNTNERRAYADEVEAMKYAAGKGAGSFTYLDEKYPDLAGMVQDTNITWDMRTNQDGGYLRQWAEFYAAGDLNFFGKEVTLDGLLLNFNKHANQDALASRDIYANGGNLTIARYNQVVAAAAGNTTLYPNLYGGTAKTTEDNKKKGGNITILANDSGMKFYDLKDFTNLTVGDNGVSGRSYVGVYGQLGDKLAVEDNGNGGTLYLKQGYVQLFGFTKSYVSQMKITDSNSNALMIPKDHTNNKNKTYPLQISGNLTLDNPEVETNDGLAARRLWTAVTNSPMHGDVLVQFAKETDAKENQYRSGHDGFIIRQNRRSIILSDTANKPLDQIYLYETVEGEELDDTKNLIGKYRTYAEAFEEVDARKADKIYTFKNVVPVDFTQDDQDELLKTRNVKEFVFISSEKLPGYNATVYYNRYPVTFRIPSVELPSDYKVTFNGVMGCDLTGRFEIFNNGGSLHFGPDFTSRDKGNGNYEIIVYGGAASGTCDKNVSIVVEAGQFNAIYGGNKEGTHTGNVEITVDSPSDKIAGRNLYINRLDGAGRERSQAISDAAIAASKAGLAGPAPTNAYVFPEVPRDNAQAEARITIRNTQMIAGKEAVQVENLYNYDELRIEKGELTIPNKERRDENIIASLLTGYKGKTVICDGAKLNLLNYQGYKKLGSLVRQANADVTKQASLYYYRTTGYYVEPTDSRHPFVIELTGADPFGVDEPEFNGCKITVSNNAEMDNEVVFKLTGVKDDEHVTLKGIKSGFVWYNLYPKYEDKTIRLESAYTMVTDPAGNRTKYRDIAGAITAVADMEKARKAQGNLENWNTYKISFFRNEAYIMNWKNTATNESRAHADEVEVMKYAAGKGTGSFTYLGEKYPDLAGYVQDANITWDMRTNQDGGYLRQWAEFYAAGDLNFFGKEVRLEGLLLNFNKHGNQDALPSRDIYANGSDLTITWDNQVVAAAGGNTKLYPSLYGGTGKTVDTNTKKGGNITILANDNWMKFYDLKDFTNLTIGDRGRIGRASVTVYGQLNDKLTTGENKTAGGAALFFQKLGDGFLQAVGLQKAPVVDNGGTLYFNNAYIPLLGYQKSYVTNVRVNDTDTNHLVIPKDITDNANLTYPLQVAEKLTLDNLDVETDTTNTALINKRLYMTVSTTPMHGDVLVQFTKEEDAKEKQYRSGHAGFMIRKNRRSIILSDTANKPLDQIYLYKTVEGEALDDNTNLVGKYRTYAEAFEEVGAGKADKIYTFKNVVPVDFTQDDQDELLKKRNVKEFVFISSEKLPEYNATVYYNRYPVTFRIPSVELPSDYKVTFNGVIGSAKAGRFEIINNGGSLRFGPEFTTIDNGNRALDLIVYGGAEQGACAKDVDILVEAGQFYAIYGGNKEGTYTGNVNITIDCPVERIAAPNANKLYITRLDGATAATSNLLEEEMLKKSKAGQALTWQPGQEQRDNQNKKVSITIKNTPAAGKTGVVQICKLYNYDELDIASGTLKMLDSGYDYNLIASLVGGYAGKTVICDNAELRIENIYGYKMLGSLVRQADADVTQTAKLYFRYVREYAGRTYKSADHPFVIRLTAEDPFGLKSGMAGKRIQVYGEGQNENLIVFKTQRQEDVTLKTLESIFSDYGFIPGDNDQTIRMSQAKVLLMAPDKNNMSKHVDIASALILMAEKEEQRRQADAAYPGGEYIVSFFRYNTVYRTSDYDTDAMKLAAGKKAAVRDAAGQETDKQTQVLNWRGEEYANLAMAGKAAKVTWGARMNINGDPMEAWIYMQPTGEMNFFGTETSLYGMRFNYDETIGKNPAQSKDIYGNGSNITFENLTHMDGGTHFPNLYGGSSDKPDPKATRGGTITIQSNSGHVVRFDSVKDFNTLVLGSEGLYGRPVVQIEKRLDSSLDETGFAKEDAGREMRTGTLQLRSAELRFINGGQGHVGNIVGDMYSTQYNRYNHNAINIYKANVDGKGVTAPLYVDGTVTLNQKTDEPANAYNKLEVIINGQLGAAYNDLVLVFAKEPNADREHYRHASLGVNKILNKIYLSSNIKYKVVTKNLTGYISTIQQNGDNTDTLYYLSKYNAATGAFDLEPDWKNFGTVNGKPDVTIIPLVKPNGEDLRLDLMKNQIAGVTKDSSILFDYTTDEKKGDGWESNDGWYYIPDMKVTFLRARYYTTHLDIAENGGTLTFDQCYNADNAPVGPEGGGHAYQFQWRTNNKKLGKMVFIPSDKHKRIIPYEDKYLDKAETVEWKAAADPEYAYLDVAGYVNNYKRFVVDTGDRRTLNLGGMYVEINHHNPGVIGTDARIAESEFELKGTGELWMNTVASSGGNIRNFITTGTFTVTGEQDAADGVFTAPTLVKGNNFINSYKNVSVLYVYKDYVSNGYRLNIKMASQENRTRIDHSVVGLEERESKLDNSYSGENVAYATEPGILDATDFELQSLNRKANHQYLTSTQNGKQIIVTVLDNPVIRVSPAAGGTEYFDTYREAFDAIQSSGTGQTYTVTNLLETNFEKTDQEALLAVTRDKAERLILESGYRGDGNTDGEAGTRYRVRMRVQTLQLPKNVDVTFQDIVMKYDQGTNSELTKEVDGNTVNVQDMVFAGNGGALTFGDGVVFLQHKDEPMYPTVYGGSITDALDVGAAVTIQSGTYASVYGAGTAAQTGDVNVELSGGSVEELFGGGRTAAGSLTGSTRVAVSGGTIRSRSIYGGGDGAEVTGNTNIEITAPLVTTEQERQSVYGGGKDAIVKGDTSIDMTLPNQMANANIYFDTISGYGTQSVTGPDQKVTTELADNVEGAVKRISIKTQDKTKRGDASVKVLSGFTELGIGHEEEANADFNYSHVTVTERFDSKPVGASADMAVKDRTDTVKLNYSGLILKGDFQGHIGNLITKGETVIYIYKKAPNTNETIPLLLDGEVTLTTKDSIKLRSVISNNLYEDRMLGFTTADKAVLVQQMEDGSYAAKYRDGEKNLTVSNLTENEIGYITFRIPPAHTLGSYVTYAPEDQVVLEGSQDVNGVSKKPGKVLHFEYDRQNQHPVNKAYVIAMPKTLAEEAGKENADAQKVAEAEKYTKMDESYINSGVFSDPALYQTTGDAKNVWPVTWTTDTSKENYAAGTTGDASPVTVDDGKYWYILHVVCQHGEQYSELVDVSAPDQIRAEVTSYLDGAAGKYSFVIYMADHAETDSLVRPFDNKGNGRLTYNADGVAYAYWAVGEQDTLNYEHQAADNKAAVVNLPEKEEITVNVGRVDENGLPVLDNNGNQIIDQVKQDTVKIVDGRIVYQKQVETDPVNGPLRGEAKVEYAGTGTVKVYPPGVVGGNEAKITVEVDKAVIDAAVKKGDQTVTNVLWVYVKDQANNTRKLAIPINENLIDVTVPLKIGVVAVRSADGVETLLAPECFVRNNGETSVRAAINGFTTNAGQKLNLSLVDQDTGEIAGNKLSLHLKPIESTKDDKGTPWNTFRKTNVLQLGTTPLELGVLSPAGAANWENYLGFTFGAHYNAAEIVYPDDADRDAELKNTMTYHFERVK